MLTYRRLWRKFNKRITTSILSSHFVRNVCRDAEKADKDKKDKEKKLDAEKTRQVGREGRETVNVDIDLENISQRSLRSIPARNYYGLFGAGTEGVLSWRKGRQWILSTQTIGPPMRCTV